MRRAAIVSPIRTGVGKYLGSLSSLNAEDLAAIVIKDLVSRTGIDPTLVEEVVFAQGYPSGEAQPGQAPDGSRWLHRLRFPRLRVWQCQHQRHKDWPQ